jgi:hypothetical protein
MLEVTLTTAAEAAPYITTANVMAAAKRLKMETNFILILRNYKLKVLS